MAIHEKIFTVACLYTLIVDQAIDHTATLNNSQGNIHG